MVSFSDSVIEGAPQAGPQQTVQALRLGVVSYLNSEPLVYGLAGDARFRIERDVPARVADRLHKGAIDLGLIPSIEFAGGDYRIVPGLGIGSHGAVRSVCLFHRRPLAELRRVALDTSSRTSVVLLKVLLKAHLHGREPEYVGMAPQLDAMLADADAALVIGDPALYAAAHGISCLDLGEEWRTQTGLPFVFAFWAGRPDVAGAAEVAALQAAAAGGLRHLDQVAASYNTHQELNASYLRANIAYTLGEEGKAGLREFYRRAHAAGLIARLPELRFYDDP